ncbi:MAG: CvpA family protein [Acetobacteraceae bacterium]|nr:CvpA family protein [Acetobacteraceae bacterium]
MTWVDLAVLGVLAISALLAFLRGLVREVLGIGAWIGAVMAAIEALPMARDVARKWITEPAWIDPVSFLAVFLVTLIVLSLVARFVGRMVRGSALGGVDRSLGLVFGLARGAALVILAYIVGGLVEPVDHWPGPVLEARALSPAYEGANWVVKKLPAEYRPHLSPPPPGRETTAEALLHATPQGRATGKPQAGD